MTPLHGPVRGQRYTPVLRLHSASWGALTTECLRLHRRKSMRSPSSCVEEERPSSDKSQRRGYHTRSGSAVSKRDQGHCCSCRAHRLRASRLKGASTRGGAAFPHAALGIRHNLTKHVRGCADTASMSSHIGFCCYSGPWPLVSK